MRYNVILKRILLKNNLLINGYKYYFPTLFYYIILSTLKESTVYIFFAIIIPIMLRVCAFNMSRPPQDGHSYMHMHVTFCGRKGYHKFNFFKLN